MFGEAMNTELKKALADYFEGWELVELLDIKADDVLDAFEDMVEDRLDEICEHAGIDYKENDDDGTE